ncbi:hypothetical protein ER70_10785, partial (plasmid) [Borreliella bissettiae]
IRILKTIEIIKGVIINKNKIILMQNALNFRSKNPLFLLNSFFINLMSSSKSNILESKSDILDSKSKFFI